MSMDDYADIDLELEFEFGEDPSATGVTALIAGQSELTLPWKKNASIQLGQGVILSGKTINSPPTRNSPFAQRDPKLKAFVFREQCNSKYREETTNGSSSSMTHISGSIEVNVDLVLISGNARGEYDKLARANTDTEKASIHSSFRTGVIQFRDLPRFSMESWEHVPKRFSPKVRQAEFVDMYGDYYVAGLILGADNSLMLSASESSKSKSESLDVKVTVRVLFYKKSFSHSSRSQSSELRSEVNVAGFDSLDNEVVDIRPRPRPLPPGFDAKSLARALGANAWLAAVIEQILTRPQTDFHVDWDMIYNHIDKARTLESRVRDKMAKFGLVDGAEVSEDTCKALINAGLVAEILLVPISKHPAYVEARSSIF